MLPTRTNKRDKIEFVHQDSHRKKKRKDNMHSFLISLELCIFSVIILSKRCAGADPQYEACLPTNCGRGQSISFPFHVRTIQDSYCGYPGFAISCRNELPILQLSGNEFVVDDIFYHNRSLRVYNAAALTSVGSSCFTRITNTSLPADKFGYVNVTYINLLSDCKNISEELLKYEVSCGSFGERDNGTLALYDSNGHLRHASGRCEKNVIAPVELYGDDEGSEDEVVDVAEVLRRGFVMNWTASDCNDCEESGGRCGFNESSFHFRCFCPDKPHSLSCRPGNYTTLKKILFIGGTTIAALTSTLTIVFVFIRRKRAKAKQEHEKDIKLFLKNNGNLVPMRYKYSSIKKMTKSFSENLGKGGYGSVYKGQFPDGHLVAVKILNESNGNGEEFMNEVASISRTSHINIVALLGFCFEGSKRALIYDFMPNGSLEKLIAGNTASSYAESGLGWNKLFDIALGIARGLEYLHQGCNARILHLDIKPQNILLDRDLNPRISDFGLAKLCPNRSSIVSMLVARGTVGYIAPEVFSRNFGEVSYKSDVYSYGMLVLEMVGARNNIDPRDVDDTSEIYFPHYIYKQLEMDAERNCDLHGAMNEDESQVTKRNLIIVGLWCIQTNPKDRPSMTKVVEMLEGKLGALEVPPKPYLYSPPRTAPSVSTSESL